MTAGSLPGRPEGSPRTPANCPNRNPLGPGPGGGWSCRVVDRAVGPPPVPVGPDACRACCDLEEPAEERWNAVIASLVFQAAGPGGSPARQRAAGALAIEPGDPSADAPAPQIGLLGWNTATGLGSLNRALARCGGVSRWLVPDHPRFPTLGLPEGLPLGIEVSRCPRWFTRRSARSWLRGLDWLLFAETPLDPGLLVRARELGVGVACLPMWEWTHPGLDWLDGVDLMVCPTAHTFQLLRGWPSTYGFPWEGVHFHWPIEVDRFAFRPRGVCRRFVFVNGRGGSAPVRADGSTAPYRRKGLDVLLGAAKRLPGVPFLVHSQERIEGRIPPNVEIRPESPSDAALYDEGDVCVQPSRWEGIGLPLLEAQAAGLPLVTTDAAPMNEYKPAVAVTPGGAEAVCVGGNWLTAWQVRPDDLAGVLDGLVGRDLSEESRAARAFVERQHSWSAAGPLLASALTRSF